MTPGPSVATFGGEAPLCAAGSQPHIAVLKSTKSPKDAAAWKPSDVKAFARKMRALVQAAREAEWSYTLEDAGDLGEQIVVECDGWTARSSPIKAARRFAQSDPATWGDSNRKSQAR